jgi:beta-catenin-like protein 1
MNSARKRPRPSDGIDEDGGSGGTTSSSSGPTFIASDTFDGSRPGYVFRRGAQGTGYYLDASSTEPPPPTSTPRKGVRIAEERNETRVYTTAEELLAAAEEAQPSGQRVLDLGNPSSLKNSVTAWQKAVQENELQRAQYPDDATQYMDSEVALYEHIHAWKAIAADANQFYPILLETSTCDLAADILGPLLQHVNTDVTKSTINLFLEWLDPALLIDDERDSVVEPVLQLASTLLQEGILDLVLANLGRFLAEEEISNQDDSKEDDDVGRGVWDILQLLEHLIDMETMLASGSSSAPRSTLSKNGLSLGAYLASQSTLFGWLFGILDEDKSESVASRYQERALEILALLAPVEDVHIALEDWTKIPPYSSVLVEDSGNVSSSDSLDAIEILLQIVGGFRKRQPETSEEVDFLENCALVVNSALTYSTRNRSAFLEAQGVELVARCLKERVHAAGVTLQWLDVPGTDASVNLQTCERIVQAQLLKYLFPLWMGKSLPVQAPPVASSPKKQKYWKQQIYQNTIRIVYSLTRHLTPDSPQDAQARLVTKFASDAAKIERLVHFLIVYDDKARTAEYKFFRSDVEDTLEGPAVKFAALEAKLAAGGDIFHRLAAIAAFLCAHSKQCHTSFLKCVREKEAGMGLIQAGVKEFISVIEEGSVQRRQLETYLESI